MKSTKYTTYPISAGTVTNTSFRLPSNDNSGAVTSGTAVIYYIS